MRLGKINLDQKEIEAQNIIKNIERGMVEIAPLVTKNLIERFEKTGSSPVFLKDGQITGLKFLEVSRLHPEEWSDLEKDVSNYKNSFWFLEYDQTKYAIGIYTLLGRALVVSKQSGKSKEYEIMGGSHFVANLIHDIKNNFFN